MALQTFSCPECQAQLKLAAGMTAGLQVRCPRCGFTFAAPAVDDDLAAPDSAPAAGEPHYSRAPVPPLPPEGQGPDETSYARSPRLAFSSAHGRRDRDFEDDYEGRLARPRGVEGLSGDYTIDLGEWFRVANQHYGDVFGPMIGYLFVFLLISMALGVIPCVSILATILLDPPLQAGFTVVALAQLRGKRWTFGDFFGGFQFWGNIVANNLLNTLILVALIVPGGIGLVIASDARDEIGLAVCIGALGVGVLTAIYLLLRLSLFATALMIDRDCGPIEAMRGSWILSSGNFWGLLGVSFLLGMINLGGALLCGIGLLFTMPWTLMIMNAGYCIITAERQPDAEERFTEA